MNRANYVFKSLPKERFRKSTHTQKKKLAIFVHSIQREEFSRFSRNDWINLEQLKF